MNQVVIIWIIKSTTTPEMAKAMQDRCDDLTRTLKKAGIRVKLDDRTDKNPGTVQY